MRTTILTEHWLPNRSMRSRFHTGRRSGLAPAKVAAMTQPRDESRNSTKMLTDARDRDAANDPAQALIEALVSCLTATIRRRAAAAGIRVRSIEPRVEGEIDLACFTGEEADIERWYRQLKIAVSVDGNAKDETLEHLVRTSQHAVLAGVRCGIHWC